MPDEILDKKIYIYISEQPYSKPCIILFLVYKFDPALLLCSAGPCIKDIVFYKRHKLKKSARQDDPLLVPITSTQFSTLFIFRNRPKYNVLLLVPLDRKFTFLFALKDRESGHSLIHNRAMKGNGFDAGLTSQINYYFSKI